MPATVRQTTNFPVVLRELEVLRIRDLTTGMRRITLTGPQLGAADDAAHPPRQAFTSPGFDDDFRILLPYPGEIEPVLPLIRDGRVTFADGRRPLARAYTVRRFDPVSLELDVDVALHGSGIATAWACNVRPGERVHIAGPGLSRELPSETDWLLIAGDETALPAIARLLEELPITASAQVFIEIAEKAHQQPLRVLPGVLVTWLPRRGAPAGTTTLLLDAVRTAPWWPGSPFAWIAGEQSTVRALRRHLVLDRHLPKPRIDFTGYWKHGGDLELEDPDAPVDA
ncbi:NADPH-dependent ferric siderophore reductase [Kocuria polaris]|nr:NADPH-dependent ferric siderophore reductase [Kocuria polaris]